MTKTKKRNRKPPPPRLALFDQDSFLIGLATSAVQMTQAEFAEKYFRPVVCRILAECQIDPAGAWKKFEAASR